MKITYDKKADAMALVFRDARVSKDTKLGENVFAGFDRDGQLVEIQVLEASSIEQPWVTLEAAAKLLGKSTRTLLRWIEDGKIAPHKVGRDYRFSPAMVQQLAGEPEPEVSRKRTKRRSG